MPTGVNGLVDKATGWVDTFFGFFGLYTTKYSKAIVYIIGLAVIGSFLKIKLNIGGGRHK